MKYYLPKKKFKIILIYRGKNSRFDLQVKGPPFKGLQAI